MKEKRSYTGHFLKPVLGKKYVPAAKKRKGGESVSEAAEWLDAVRPNMSEILRRVQTLVMAGDYRVSDHGYDELADDDILLRDVIGSIASAVALEDYSDRRRVLSLHRSADDAPVHVVWAMSEDRQYAVLVTAYRPDPTLWDDDFKTRSKR